MPRIPSFDLNKSTLGLPSIKANTFKMCLIFPYFVVFLKKEIPNSTLLSLLHGKINRHYSIVNALYFFFSALCLQECHCCHGDATFFLLF
jgi:hypothetical protein